MHPDPDCACSGIFSKSARSGHIPLVPGNAQLHWITHESLITHSLPVAGQRVGDPGSATRAQVLTSGSCRVNVSVFREQLAARFNSTCAGARNPRAFPATEAACTGGGACTTHACTTAVVHVAAAATRAQSGK